MAESAILTPETSSNFRHDGCVLCRTRNILTKFGEERSISNQLATDFRNPRWRQPPYRLLVQLLIPTPRIRSTSDSQHSHQIWWGSVHIVKFTCSIPKERVIIHVNATLRRSAFISEVYTPKRRVFLPFRSASWQISLDLPLQVDQVDLIGFPVASWIQRDLNQPCTTARHLIIMQTAVASGAFIADSYI